MSTIADLVIRLGVKDDATSGVQKATSKMTGTLTKVGKAAAFVGGAAALGGLAETLKVGYGEWQDSTKIQAQTAAALKSTGNAAGVTASHVSNLAGALLAKSGVDDEAIQSGENLLLTFTNIKNEAGKGNDVFDQTTKTMLDMSVALGQDTSSSALQLGKALNNPIQGVSALQRVGVTFTESQKAQIQAMVDAGNTMGAQKLILGELNKEFGGSAETVGKTLPGQISILKESFNNLAGQVVGELMPVMMNAVSWLNAHWTQISAVMNAVFQGIAFTVGNILVPAIRTIITVGMEIVAKVREHWGQISSTVESTVSTIKAVVTTGTAIVKAIWSEFGSTIKTVVTTDLGVVVTVIKNALTIVGDTFKLLTDLIHGRWGDAWGDLKGIVSAAFDLVKGVLTGELTVLGAVLSKVGSIVASPFVAAFNDVKSAATGAFEHVKNVAGSAGDAIGALLKAPINAVIGALDAIRFPTGVSIGHKHVLGVDIPSGVSIDWGSLNIPMLAAGALATGPTLAMVGEGRNPEAVLPLTPRVLADIGEGIADASPRRGGGNVTIQGDLVVKNETDARLIARDLAWRLGA